MFVSIIDLKKSNMLLFLFSICGIYLWLVPLFVRFVFLFSQFLSQLLPSFWTQSTGVVLQPVKTCYEGPCTSIAEKTHKIVH